MGARNETYGPLAVDDLVLDRYRVIEHVATGGHSEVYRGRDERLSRPVCIKVFSKFPDDPGVWRTAYEHFVQEAFALSRLTHPNTLRIYDFGHLSGTGVARRADDSGSDGRSADDIGTPLQVSEFMNGGTLSQLVRERGAQPVAETLRLAATLCEALDEAHEVGLVHRDIKPQNILFAAAGGTRIVKLADFGIAKWREAAPPAAPRLGDDFSERAGDTQVVAGIKMAMYSPSWAAPEQLAGKSIGPPADIYSLAVVVVYMLTGRAIFAEEDVHRGYRKRRRVAEVLRDAVAPLRLPGEAIAVLAHALAFDPDQRPRRASDLAHELIEAFEPRTMELQRTIDGSLRASSFSPDALAADALVPSAASFAAAGLDGGGGRRIPARPPTEEPGELPPAPPTPAPVKVAPVAAEPVTMTAASPAVPAAPVFAVPTEPRLASAAATSRHAVPRRIAPATTQRLVDRTLHFAASADGIVDLTTGPSRLRVTVMPTIDGRRPIHVAGLSCFVTRRGGRPSAAVLLDGDGDFDLVSPRSQIIASGRLSRGSPAAGHTIFQVGTEMIAVDVDDCPDPLLIDFGPGADCHIIYVARRDQRARRGARRMDST